MTPPTHAADQAAESGVTILPVVSPTDLVELENQFKKQQDHGLRMRTVPALILFFAINLLLSFTSPIEFDAYKFKYSSWAWWVFNDLKQHADIHNLALLGSSLTVSAVAGCDANYLQKPLDLTGYHKASYLDNLLRTKFGGEFSTFNLSSPGQMPSDAYMMLKSMVNTADRPDIVIYGVAPRDFIDSTLSSPIDTEPYHYLRRLVNLDEVANGFFKSPYARLDWWLGKNLYLYGYSLDFQMLFSDLAQAYVNTVVPKPPHPNFTWWDRVKLLPAYLPGEIRPAAMMSNPMKREQGSTYTDNTKEYLARYKQPDPHTYRTQFYFLRHLAEYCRREKIDLIVVNMPLTRVNVNILRPGRYLQFVQDLRQFAYNSAVPFFDLNDFSLYETKDFHDSVHLNAFGGTKFFDSLIHILDSDKATRTALYLAGRGLAHRQQLASRERILN